jgi:O-acetylhomoserine (thiol)-lyase
MTARGFTTRIVHSDRSAGIEHGAIHKPIHTSIPFAYRNSLAMVRTFQGEQAGFTYARNSQPTTQALEEKVTAMEEGLGTVAFASGMSAIASTLLALLRCGDHIVSSSHLFSNTNSLFDTLAGLGLSVSFVDATDTAHVEAAITARTRLVFVETIANPRTQVADLRGIGELCKRHGLIYLVDNTMTSPYLFKPKDVGASLVINSLTKCISGHANALGGAVTETGLYDWSRYSNIYDSYKKGDPSSWGILQIRKKGLRDGGAALAPDAAHRIAVGAETLALRMERMCANALHLSSYLEAQPKVARVYYPGLESHPQHRRAETLFRRAGGLLAFELVDGDCLHFLDRLEIVVCSSHLADTRTLAIPVAHTIFHETGVEGRARMGIADSLIRVSTGIEDIEDLVVDFDRALTCYDTRRSQ